MSVSELEPGVGTTSHRGRSMVSTAELHALVGDPDTSIVDVRPLHAFNGWPGEGEARGGHVPGAVAFPAAWLADVGDAEALELLSARGIVAGRDVVLYGAAPDVEAVATRLVGLGYDEPRVYGPGWPAWALDAALPVERLPRYERLVHVDWLRALLAGRPVESAPSTKVLLFHVNFGVPAEYAESHLPGAVHLDTNRLESPEDWNRRSPEALEEALQALGITTDSTVVLYGRDTEGDPSERWPGRRAGQISAMRAALILHYCGVEDVRLLDGGYDAWVRAGGPLETTVREPTPVDSFGSPIPRRPSSIVDLDGAKRILADREGAALVSVRTWSEHIGEVSGYNYIGPAGRIAGDVWGNCGTDAYHMQHYRTADNAMRPYPEIVANWAEAGITPEKWVAFYCGTGWRASETWFYAHLMGWPRIAVYDGGWLEWSADPVANPIEVGEPRADRSEMLEPRPAASLARVVPAPGLA